MCGEREVLSTFLSLKLDSCHLILTAPLPQQGCPAVAMSGWQACLPGQMRWSWMSIFLGATSEEICLRLIAEG